MKKFLYSIMLCLLLVATSFAFVGCNDKLFEVEVEPSSHGIISVSKSQAREGEEIVINAYPDAGYELALITCDGVAVENMRFKMPKRDVELQAFFRASLADDKMYQLKMGTYSCEGFWGEDGLYKSYAPTMRYCFAIFKEGNKVDAFYEGNLISDISYSRSGNFLSMAIAPLQLSLEIEILSDDLIFFKADDAYVVMQHQSDIVMPTGTFKSVYKESTPDAQNVTIIFKEGRKLDLIVGDYINSQDIEYVVYGTRLVINYTDENINGIYVEVELPSGQEINYFELNNLCIMRTGTASWMEQQETFLHFYKEGL